MTDLTEVQKTLLDAAVPHVAFDGWSAATLKAAAADTGIPEAQARAAFPRGAVDLALAYHRQGDAVMLARLAEADLSDMRFRDRIAAAVRYRLEAVEDRELVRRGTTLFSLPQNAGEGARAIWGTVDAIWDALGDKSEDVNWYTKRGTLAGVYSATVLFWLGDDSPDHANTWAFLDRRIDNVMQFEKLKAKTRDNPLFKPLGAIFGKVRAPSAAKRDDLPGHFSKG
ncbi:COQ9 family protein [Actibacterium sp. XHP0104]|uniref:COQ9 family protein n=1 Tax=Actibacterium sp. XHP0104 TaxID=2984335 RepID=UPI0021E7244A|nr:COQ9 family protein [Actibacterium sp. XHP0104]MCV2882848.1 COQ9 family protein [Actibacterium sp. XHP0104]